VSQVLGPRFAGCAPVVEVGTSLLFKKIFKKPPQSPELQRFFVFLAKIFPLFGCPVF